MNWAFKFFILIFADIFFSALNAATGTGTLRHPSVRDNAPLSLHFEPQGTITRIVNEAGEVSTPGNLHGITRTQLLFLSTITYLNPGPEQQRIDWGAFRNATGPTVPEPFVHPKPLQPALPPIMGRDRVSFKTETSGNYYRHDIGCLSVKLSPDESYEVTIHPSKEKVESQTYGYDGTVSDDPHYFDKGSAIDIFSGGDSQGDKRNALALKINTVIADYLKAYPDTLLPKFHWGTIKPTPEEVDFFSVLPGAEHFSKVKGTHTETSLISYENGTASSAETILIELSGRRIKQSYHVTFDASTQNIISITEPETGKNIPLTTEKIKPLITAALIVLKEHHQLPEKLCPQWIPAPTVKASITLNDKDSSRWIPSASSVATTLAVASVIYAGEQSETVAAIGNGILDTVPLEKFHAYVEEKAPMVLKKHRIVAASVATLAVIVDHLITTNAQTCFQPYLGQAAQLSLCGWATYRLIEKILTPL